MKPDKAKVVNVTGAGDAFIAGVGYGYLANLPLIETVKLAQTMSLITISHEETIHPNLCYQLVDDWMNQINWQVKQYS